MSWPGLPILVRLTEPVILLGDGEAAEAKRRLLERAGATVVADAADARLAIVAIEDEAEARAAVERLRARGVLVNAVDRPALCDFTLPAVVDRSPVLVAVATGGVSAGLAAAVRQRLEGLLPASLGRLAEALAGARDRLRDLYPDPGERRRTIGATLARSLDPLGQDSADRVEEVLLRRAGPIPASTLEADTGPRTTDAGGHRGEPGVTIVLTSPDPDDLTLRQARALALADRVLHAPGVPAAILARARADAPRIAQDARPAQIARGDIWLEMA